MVNFSHCFFASCNWSQLKSKDFVLSLKRSRRRSLRLMSSFCEQYPAKREIDYPINQFSVFQWESYVNQQSQFFLSSGDAFVFRRENSNTFLAPALLDLTTSLWSIWKSNVIWETSRVFSKLIPVTIFKTPIIKVSF